MVERLRVAGRHIPLVLPIPPRYFPQSSSTRRCSFYPSPKEKQLSILKLLAQVCVQMPAPCKKVGGGRAARPSMPPSHPIPPRSAPPRSCCSSQHAPHLMPHPVRLILPTPSNLRHSPPPPCPWRDAASASSSAARMGPLRLFARD